MQGLKKRWALGCVNLHPVTRGTQEVIVTQKVSLWSMGLWAYGGKNFHLKQTGSWLLHEIHQRRSNTPFHGTSTFSKFERAQRQPRMF